MRVIDQNNSKTNYETQQRHYFTLENQNHIDASKKIKVQQEPAISWGNPA